MDIIAVCSQKGGAGKTTTAINLAAAFALNAKKVLLIDLDPQAHATMGLNISAQRSIYDVLSKVSRNKCSLADTIVEVEKNFFMAPSSIVLSTIDQELADEIGRESRMRDVLFNDFDKDAYDYIIIDCPPNLGLLTINALRAANNAIIPVEASRFSFEGVTQVVGIIDLVCERLRHQLDFRVLVSNFDSRLQHSFQILNRIKQTFQEKVFTTIIHINVKLKESQAAGKTVFSYDRYSRGAKDFYSLSREIISGIQREVTMADVSAEMKAVVQRKVREFQDATFTFAAPAARSVFVIGDFNNWSRDKAIALEKKDSGWSATIPLRKGSYQYRFIVDDCWVADPANPRVVKNPFGELNSLLEVK